MAAKRLAKSTVDWAALAERVPPNQRELFRAFKGKCEGFVSRVHQYPAELPKIDFKTYKAMLPNPALADQFEKAYASLTIPYPKDKDQVKEKISAEEREALEKSKAFVKEMEAQMNAAKAILSKIDKVPAPDSMTYQMYAHYFPDKALDPVNRPTFWPHTPNTQPGHKDADYIK